MCILRCHKLPCLEFVNSKDTVIELHETQMQLI